MSSTLNYSDFNPSNMKPIVINNVNNDKIKYNYCDNFPKTINDIIMDDQHYWVNNCNYGNICLYNMNNNVINQVTKKYNKLPPLTLPVDTSVDINMAWDI